VKVSKTKVHFNLCLSQNMADKKNLTLFFLTVDIGGFQRSVCHFREKKAFEIYIEVLLQYG
jgi:hypothetical protein